MGAGVLDFGCRRGGGRVVQVGNRDLRALVRECERDFLADAAGGAGDDCNLAIE
jgi:hypothetical protein